MEGGRAGGVHLEELAAANVANLRDFGGYRTASGTVLKRGRLFRSGQLDTAGPSLSRILAKLGITTIIDLRSRPERVAAGGPAFVGFTGVVQAATTQDQRIPHALDHFLGLSSPAEVAARMSLIYRMLPSSEQFRESMGNFARAVTGDRGGTLIHCFAGKDRTGLAVALLHLGLGVHRDDVLHDYLLTNAMGPERVETGLRWLSRGAPVEAPEWLLHEIMSVRAEYLEAGLAEIAAAGISPAQYAATIVGVSPDEFARSTNQLLC